MARRLGLLLVVLALGCAEGSSSGDDAGVDSGPGVDAGDVMLPEPLAPLPGPRDAQTEYFRNASNCSICHLAGTSEALRDASGRDVSQSALWQTSMMAFAGRDPIYLATFAHELEEFPAARPLIEATCTRCHAPAASHERTVAGGHESFEALTSGTDNIDALGREGVTCTMCHQITDEGLGTEASFTGGWVIGETRELFGPHADPDVDTMMQQSGFTPALATHLGDSASCATCHTVITRALDDAGEVVGPPFPEQVPYLEWLNSEYVDGGPRDASCQDCHTPTRDDFDQPIMTAIANRPAGLLERSPYSLHTFRGANAYALELIRDNQDFVGTQLPRDVLTQSAIATEAFLATSATVTIESAVVEGTTLNLRIRVENECGHKFPTSYPTRRAWLRVTATGASGQTLWVSGAVNAQGALIDDRGRILEGPLAPMPHRDMIDRQDQVQVWHTEMADLEGERTHVLLRAGSYLLDNRILPHGWSPDGPNAALSAPVGTEDDDDFVPGSDTVDYRIPEAGVMTVRAELLYQPITPTSLDALVDHPTPAYTRLRMMTDESPPAPRLVDSATIRR